MNTEIETLADYLGEIDPLSDATELRYIYRGQKNKTWRVQSSAARRLLKKLHHPDQLHRPLPTRLFIGYLCQIVDEIKLRYTHTYSNMEPLECMAHLQHNKVATGLIDFTYNPLVALWIACEVDSPKDEDGKVFMLDTHSKNIKEVKNRDKIENKGLECFFQDDKKWHLWQPSIGNSTIDTDRITIQQSVFMFGMPEMSDDMFKRIIIVPKKHKEKLLAELTKIGIMEKTLFSDLAGFIERNNAESDYNIELADHHMEAIQASETKDGK